MKSVSQMEFSKLEICSDEAQTLIHVIYFFNSIAGGFKLKMYHPVILFYSSVL